MGCQCMNMNDYKAIAERTKYARKQLTNLNQDAMADALGISRSAYAQYETGRTPIQSRHLIIFCELTGVSASWLLSGKGEMILKDNPIIAALDDLDEKQMDELESYIDYLKSKGQK